MRKEKEARTANDTRLIISAIIVWGFFQAGVIFCSYQLGESFGTGIDQLQECMTMPQTSIAEDATPSPDNA